MILPGIKNTILDGALGVKGAQADGRFAAIGVAEKHGGEILTFNEAAQVERAIGDGPLRDLLVSSLSIARTSVSVIVLEGSVPGTVSEVKAGEQNAKTGSIAVSGKPRNDYQIKVAIEASGGLNEAVFRLTIDGLGGRRITFPDGEAKHEIAGTGLTIQFVPGESGFEEGDTYSFSTTAPEASSQEVLQAVGKILDAKLNIEFIAIAGVTAAPLRSALAVMAEAAAENYQYLFFVTQARFKKENESLDAWVNALCGAERGSTASSRLQACAAWIEEADINGKVDTRGLIGTYCGSLARRRVQDGPDAVKFGGIAAALRIKPDGLNDGHIARLKEAGYVTVRQIAGRRGVFITSGRMMSEEGSDFDVVERRRVMDKACRNLYIAQLPSVNDTVKISRDGTPEGLEMFQAVSKQPFEIMKTNREISDGFVFIPEGQNILADKKLRTKVRIVPLGKMSFIENEIAYKNPALGGQP